MSRTESNLSGKGQGKQGGEQSEAGQGVGAAAANLKEKASEVASTLRDMGSSARDAATEQYENLRETASEYYESGRDKATQWQGQVEDYVREQPLKSLLLAAGVGVILGVIWKRS